MTWIYQFNQARVTRGDKLILDDVTLSFLSGAKIGVVGPNGAGKSTTLKLMAGLERPSRGEAILAPGVSVGLLPQEPPLAAATVLGNIEAAVAGTKALLARYDGLTAALAQDHGDEPLAELGRLHEQLDQRGAWELDSRLEQAMAALRCPPGATPVADLSGGERRRVALCALLLCQPDLLLLDEPTNHLDADSVQWLEQHLEQYPGTVVAVTHDRYFGVVGPNGVGKTTLFQMLVGEQRPDAGRIRVGDTVRISSVDQTRAHIDPARTAWEVVSAGHDVLTVGGLDIPSRAYLATFGFKGSDQQKPARLLSGGERNRLYLALTLTQGGNVLLLDELTNDLDVETLGSLENALAEFPGCAMITAHDRWFLDRVATHILAWEGTRDQPGRWFWFEGNFAGYEHHKSARMGAAAARPHPMAYRKLTRG